MKGFLAFLCAVGCAFTPLLAEEIYASFDVFAINQSKLAFEVGGIVKEIKVSVSKQVKKGDVLIVLNNSASASEQAATAAVQPQARTSHCQ